jgi:hypothetical protein
MPPTKGWDQDVDIFIRPIPSHHRYGWSVGRMDSVLQHGNEVTIEIEAIGSLTNPILRGWQRQYDAKSAVVPGVAGGDVEARYASER